MQLSDPLAYDPKSSDCFVCQSLEITPYLKDFRGNEIDRCPRCEVQFMNPQYSDQFLQEYYSGYTASDEADIWDEALSYGNGFYMDTVESAIERSNSNFNIKSVFDFGCGSGSFLKVARSKNWEAVGYDVDPLATAKVENDLGVKVYSGDFFAIETDKKFDLIIMHQVLEHLKDPVKYLSKLSSMLVPGGYMFIAVPNINSLSNRLKFLMEKIGVRKKRVGAYYDTSHHLFYFHKNSLENLLHKLDFKVIYDRNCHKVYPGQGRFERFFTRNVKDHLFSNSAFFVVAQKRD